MLPLQNTDEWLEWRKMKVGASDVPIILGISKYDTPLGLWKRKLGFLPPVEENANMRFGKQQESLLREASNIRFGLTFHPEVVQHPEYEWAIASLDGLSEDKTTLCEYKCNNAVNHALAAQGTLPADHYAQIQWQMFVASSQFVELKKAYYWSHNNGDDLVIEVKYDKDFIQKAFLICRTFHNDLETYTPPQELERDYTKIDDKEFGTAALNYMKAKEMLDRAKQEEEYWKKELIKFATHGNCEGYGLKLTKIEKQGSIDWQSVSKTFNIKKTDLDACRKAPVTYWKVNVSEKNL